MVLAFFWQHCPQATVLTKQVRGGEPGLSELVKVVPGSLGALLASDLREPALPGNNRL